jgi:hypothetical protein
MIMATTAPKCSSEVGTCIIILIDYINTAKVFSVTFVKNLIKKQLNSINNVFLKRNVCHILHKPKIRGIMVRKDSKNCDS